MTGEDLTVVGGTVEERDVSPAVTRSVEAALGVKAAAVAVGVGVVRVGVVVVVGVVVEEVVAALVVAGDTVAVVVALVEGSAGAVVIVVVGVDVVLLDRVTYEKGVGVGGRSTPGGYG